MRPPVRWIRSAPISICATAMVYRVDAKPGRNRASSAGEQADDAADDDGGPDVQVRAADGAVPRQRRHPQREDDPGDPLERHQAREQPVGALVNVPLVLAGRARRRVATSVVIDTAFVARTAEQPKTLVPRRSAGPRLSSATSDARPALSPAWAARSGDAAAEHQRSARVVEERLAGGLRAEPPRLRAVVVSQHGDVRKALRGSPERGLLPAGWRHPPGAGTARTSSAARGAREHFRELAERGAGAVTLRVREEDERRAIGGAHERGPVEAMRAGRSRPGRAHCRRPRRCTVRSPRRRARW